MLSQNVVLFCQKGTTDQKTTSYAVLKGHFWITEKRTTVLDSPSCPFLPNFVTGSGCPKVFKKNLNASKPSEHPPQVEECRPFSFHSTNPATTDVGTPGTSMFKEKSAC